MNWRQIWQDIKSILIYIITEPFIVIWTELQDIWGAIKNKRLWIYIFGLAFIITAFVGHKQLMVFSLVMYLLFYLIQVVQERKWKARERERFYKSHGLQKFKK